MNEAELSPHIAEEIKFNLEKLHGELVVDAHYNDVVKLLVAMGERLKAKAGKIGEMVGNKKGTTEEDVAIERELGALIEGFKGSSILFSEEERTDIPPDDAKEVWISDPISNTKSFIEGRPGYAITLARQREGETDFAVVYDAARGRMFTAYRGKGAFLNGRPIHIPENQSAEKSRVAAGGSNKKLKETFGDSLTDTDLFERAKLTPQSVALNTLKILEGETDGAIILAKDVFPHFASQLIVAEAGGAFTNIKGNERLGYTDEIFVTAGSKELHTKLLEFVQELARKKGIL